LSSDLDGLIKEFINGFAEGVKKDEALIYYDAL